MKYGQKRKPVENDEFLWLISLSDLMILLFIFFVVLFSFTRSKLTQQDLAKIAHVLKNGEMPPDPIDKVHKDLVKWVEDQRLKDQISVKKTDDGVTLEIKDKLLFESAEYEPHSSGLAVMRLLSKTLEKIPAPYKVGIEGHTDDIPIHTPKINDNWDLSAKRALAVMEALQLPDPLLKRTVVMAHGQMKPIVPNRTPAGIPIPENQAKNRRVTLRIF